VALIAVARPVTVVVTVDEPTPTPVFPARVENGTSANELKPKLIYTSSGLD
jgi:hypothetical protein